MKSLRIFTLLILTILLISACGGGAKTPPTPTMQKESTKNTENITATSVATNTPEPEPTATKASSADLKIMDVTYAHGLNEDMTPTEQADAYTPEQPVYVSVKLDGNPKKGVISAKFYYKDQDIADAEIDLAQSRKDQGVIFVVGGNTYVGFTLDHENPFPISENYHTDLSLNGEPAGRYAFKVIPPDDATPSKVLSATLANNVTDDDYKPIEPTDTFAPDKEIFLAGRVTLGTLSSISASWIVNGEEDPEGARSVTANEDVEDVPFYFSYVPANGWPAGKQKVILYINDQPVGEYVFTITSGE